jgi:hypothetical protein
VSNVPPWVQSALHHLRKRGLTVELSVDPTGPATAGQLLVARGARRRQYAVEICERLTSAAIVPRLSRQEPHFFLAEHVSPDMAARCRELSVPFADAAGNIYLDWGSVVIDVEGRRPSRRPGGTKVRGRPFRPAGLQILLCLLADPLLVNRPLRDLASLADVSLGSAQETMQELTTLGHIDDLAGGRRLVSGGRLLDRWTEAYGLNLAAKLELGSYRVADVLPNLTLDAFGDAESETRWGGESAVALREQHLRPGTLTLYSARIPTRLLARWRVQQADDEANVLVRRMFWQPDLSPTPFVPSPLIYADLINSGEPRQLEAAARFRKNDERLIAVDRS